MSVVHAFLDAFPFMAGHLALLLSETVQFLEIVGVAVGIAWVLACPLGMLLGHLHRGEFIGINLANVARALPTPAIIAILLVFVGIGFTNIVIALIVAGIPPILLNAYTGIDQVPPDVVESARGVGMGEWQLLLRIEVPLAMPLLFGGLRTAVVFIIGTAPLAALIGGQGLGVIIVNQPSYGLDGVIAATLWVAALAVGADLGLGLVERALTPKTLRGSRSRARREDTATYEVGNFEIV
jgi:osmoprotectant transport system permease protein